MTKMISDDEYAVLTTKAAAWDRFLNRRLTGEGSWAIADLEIMSRGSTILEIRNHIVNTPFGKVPLAHDVGGTYNLLANDSLTISHDVKLTISN